MKTTGNSKPRYKQPIRPDSPPPFQKWCERDFRADTDHMSWLGKALYARLLQSAFAVASTRPNLPADTTQLLRLLSGVPKETWAAHEEEILAMFTKATINGIEVLVHKRLQQDFEALADYRFSQSQNKKDYWTKIRAERKKETEKLATTELQPSLKLATTEPVATHYQYEVDVEVDSDSENEKEGEGEIPLSPDPTFKDRGQEKILTDFIVRVAKGTKTDATFDQKSKRALSLEMSAINPPPTEAELRQAVSGQVRVMDPFALQNAGSRISSSLVGAIAAIRDAAKAVQDRKDDKQTIKRSEIARDDWRKKLDEANDIDQYVQDNPPPEWFVEYEGGKKSFPYADEYIDEARKSLARREEPQSADALFN